jgi:hypothetical protein
VPETIAPFFVTCVTCASVPQCRTIRFVGTLRSSGTMLLLTE